MELDAVVQGKLEADTDFNASLVDLSDEDRATAISAKKSEILSGEFASLKDKADKAEKAEEIARDQKIRAEKAERELKEKSDKGLSGEVLSPKDYLALQESKVTSEDFDEVLRVSKILGKPITEALKDSTMKSILETRNEERRSAAAAHTGGGSRGTSQVKGEDLLSKAEQTGEVPDTDEGMRELFKAKLARKLKS